MHYFQNYYQQMENMEQDYEQRPELDRYEQDGLDDENE